MQWVQVVAPGTEPSELQERVALRVRDRLQELFEGFAWCISVETHRLDIEGSAMVEPSSLLELGVLSRDRSHADLVLVVTELDLSARQGPYALATPSRALDVGVLSTARLADAVHAVHAVHGAEDAVERRLEHLALLVASRLMGLDEPQVESGVDEGVAALDRPFELSEEERRSILERLEDVADPRVEEESGRWFLPRAVAHNVEPIVRGILEMEPWLFPFRLKRLSAAAVSTVLILMTTAEVWEIASFQSGWRLGLFAVVVMWAMMRYIVVHHRLVLGRNRRTEQSVVTGLSVRGGLFMGLCCTYAAIFAVVLTLALAFWPGALVASWIVADASPTLARIQLAGFTSTMGILIGGLGASFEPPDYLRHIAYVDDEIRSVSPQALQTARGEVQARDCAVEPGTMRERAPTIDERPAGSLEARRIPAGR